jgi:adenine-specific DNA-methyltransferase
MTVSKERLQIQVELDSRKTGAERNVLGQFATPPELARQIVRSTIPYLAEGEQIRFLEPALGTGSFYEALHESARARVHSAVGVEVDPAFAQASSDLWGDHPLRVVNADFTTLDPLTLGYSANLLITNPPYVRHHHIPSEHKQHLVKLSRRITGIQPSGLAGLYIHFMLISHRWLEKDAMSAWLIPSEFMDVNYGAELKQYLTENVELLRIHRFEPEDVQFDDALVTSTVVIFRNRRARAESTVHYTVGGSMEAPRESAEVQLADLKSQRKWSCLRGTSYDDAKPNLTLGDAFTIKRGIATGDNKFFIRPLREFLERGVPLELLKPILPSPRNVSELTIESDCDGYPMLAEKLALFDCNLPEAELERRYPAAHELVQEGRAASVHEGYLCRGRAPWYSQERREPPPLLCTYMGRPKEGQPPFRIIRNRSQAVATNVYLLLYPKPWLVKADRDGQLLDRIAEELRLLSTGAFTSEGRVYGGGLHKMEPKELARMPLNLPELRASDRGVTQNVLFERTAVYRV